LSELRSRCHHFWLVEKSENFWPLIRAKSIGDSEPTYDELTANTPCHSFSSPIFLHSRQRSLQLFQRQMALAVRQSTCIAYAERLFAAQTRPIIWKSGLNSKMAGTWAISLFHSPSQNPMPQAIRSFSLTQYSVTKGNNQLSVSRPVELM
jgi:hypothetical protein